MSMPLTANITHIKWQKNVINIENKVNILRSETFATYKSS